MSVFISRSSLESGVHAERGAKARPDAQPPGAHAAAAASRLGLRDAHERDPLLEGQRAGDEPREGRGDRRRYTGALDGAREQRDVLERLHGLPEPPGYLAPGHALCEQLAGAAIARRWRERGG